MILFLILIGHIHLNGTCLEVVYKQTQKKMFKRDWMHAHNMIPILNSIVHIIGGTYTTISQA